MHRRRVDDKDEILMQDYTKKIKTLVLSDDANISHLYVGLLKKRFAHVDNSLLEDINALSKVYEYDFVLIDINKSSSIEYLAKMNANFSFRPKIIMVSPFNSGEVKSKLESLDFVDLILSKPLIPKKFYETLKNFDHEIINHYILKKTNDVMVDFFNLSPFRLGIFHLDGKLFFANKPYTEQKEKIMEAEIMDGMYFDDISNCKHTFENIKSRLLLSGESFSVDKQEEESGLWFRSHFYLLKKNLIVHKCEDITKDMKAQEKLKQSSIFFENANEGIVITDEYARILSVNSAFCRITGYTTSEVVGKTPAILQSGVHDEDFYKSMWESLTQNGTWQGEIWNKRKNGEIYPEWLSITRVEDKNTTTKNFFIAIFTDITNLKEADKKIYFYANHDHLTGLANRLNIESRFAHSLEIAKRKKEKVGILFCDIDNFKDINDTYGHHVGDEVIKEVASRISEAIRQEDTLGRIGGDEFLLVVGDVNDEKDIYSLCQKIMRLVKEPMTVHHQVFYITLSIGVAIYPDHGKNTDILKQNADLAMYSVKETGRNNFAIYNEEYSARIRQEVTILSELRNAIKNGQLEVFYQPIVDYHTHQICSAEALIRWRHPEKGLIPPVEFIQVAEDKGLINELTAEVFHQVLTDLETLNTNIAFRNSFRVAINISAKEFFAKNFAKKILGYFNGYDVRFSQIELELTETQLMRNHSVAQEIIKELKKSGFKIAIDDFGTGYSSLSYLKHFDIDILKIDKSFILDAPYDSDDESIVQAIVSMARTFNIHVHAEGVEEAVHETLVKKLRCDLGQGYLYSKPVPFKEFYEKLKQSTFI